MVARTEAILGLISQIQNDELVLPAIQREFVWGEERITNLYDSLMRGYPIGMILVWETYDLVQYRRFVTDYYEKNKITYETPSNRVRRYMVLDGQQRLQSLYVGMHGSYNGKKLYFDVLSGIAKEDLSEPQYEFLFLQDNRVDLLNKLTHPEGRPRLLLKFSDLVKMPIEDALAYSQDWVNKLKLSPDSEHAKRLTGNLNLVAARFKESDYLSRFTVDEGKPSDFKNRRETADILEIFVRVNSGGLILSKSDLMFSLMKLDWTEAIDKFDSLLERLNEGIRFKFDKDFLIKSLFTVSGFGPKYDVDRLRSKANMEIIRQNYPRFAEAITTMNDFIKSVCLIHSDYLLPSYNTLIPFIYLFYRLPQAHLPEKQHSVVKRFFYLSLMSRLFARYADSRINVYVRDYLKPELDKDPSVFPYEQSMECLQRYEEYYGLTESLLQNNLDLVLNIIQRDIDFNPSNQRNRPERDHIFPRSKVAHLYPTLSDHFANFRLLGKGDNGNKSDRLPREYFDGFSEQVLDSLYIRKDLLDLNEFPQFIEYRKNAIIKKVKEELGLSD